MTDPGRLLSDAVGTLRNAAAATPPGHPGRANTLGNLMLALQDIYDDTADPLALDEAIDTLNAVEFGLTAATTWRAVSPYRRASHTVSPTRGSCHSGWIASALWISAPTARSSQE